MHTDATSPIDNDSLW